MIGGKNSGVYNFNEKRKRTQTDRTMTPQAVNIINTPNLIHACYRFCDEMLLKHIIHVGFSKQMRREFRI